mmetsp:Transcript_104723/g.305747  ORF Transcript_104723/g.305747 Transcript_104723/m.305747 type:complete len:265 (+) Transcript_104723:1667-2461(+)
MRARGGHGRRRHQALHEDDGRGSGRAGPELAALGSPRVHRNELQWHGHRCPGASRACHPGDHLQRAGGGPGLAPGRRLLRAPRRGQAAPGRRGRGHGPLRPPPRRRQTAGGHAGAGPRLSEDERLPRKGGGGCPVADQGHPEQPAWRYHAERPPPGDQPLPRRERPGGPCHHQQRDARGRGLGLLLHQRHSARLRRLQLAGPGLEYDVGLPEGREAAGAAEARGAGLLAGRRGGAGGGGHGLPGLLHRGLVDEVGGPGADGARG